jgi:hypothetical protein
MADFNIRSDSVNVEEIMQQIRARIREKRGVDYTEEQIRELAAVKLETFMNPHAVRSGLLEQFREGGVSPFENYEFEDSTLFESHRAPLRWLRRLLRPFLKLFFNLDRLIAVLHLQSGINTRHSQFGQVSFELLHNLVVETTRLGIEVKNLKMKVESLSSRFDFAERRARALEGLVQARLEGRGEEPQPPARGRERQPPAQGRGAQGGSQQGRGSQQAQPAQAPAPAAQPGQVQGEPAAAAPAAPGREGESAGDARRRRRRRRGRRSGASRPGGEDASATEGASEPGGDQGGSDAAESTGGDNAPGGDRGDQPASPGSLPFPDRDEQ